MRTYNWHFGNLLSSWETGGRIFNLKTIHQLQLRGKNPTPCVGTQMFSRWLQIWEGTQPERAVQVWSRARDKQWKMHQAEHPGKHTLPSFALPFSPWCCNFNSAPQAHHHQRLEPVPQVRVPSLPMDNSATITVVSCARFVVFLRKKEEKQINLGLKTKNFVLELILVLRYLSSLFFFNINLIPELK